MTEKIIETITLENNLELKIIDESRIIAGDRWYIRLDAIIDIDLMNIDFEKKDDGKWTRAELGAVYGETIQYRHSQEKHFADEKDKKDIISEFTDNLKQNIIPYLSKPTFARKFALSRYSEIKKKPRHLFA